MRQANVVFGRQHFAAEAILKILEAAALGLSYQANN
jgi:hypothetical protein